MLPRFPVRCPTWRFLQPALILSMLLPAFSVAIIGLIQGAGVSQGTPIPTASTRTCRAIFLGQGVANIATSFVGGIPAGGSISGTALIMGAGAKSRWTNIFAGRVRGRRRAAGRAAGRAGAHAGAGRAADRGRFPGPARATGSDHLEHQQGGGGGHDHHVCCHAASFRCNLRSCWAWCSASCSTCSASRTKSWSPSGCCSRKGFPLEAPAPRKLPSNQLTLLHIYGSLFFAAAKSVEEMLPDVE